MKRRELLNILGIGGLASITPSLWPKFAEAALPSNRLWIVVTAAGGWDPISFCNPYPMHDYTYVDTWGNNINLGPMSSYPENFIETLGGIRYAPGITPYADRSYGKFVEKYYKELLVINGIETNTNDHNVGLRAALSGSGREDYPVFAANAASALNKTLPLSFISENAYSNTAGLVSEVSIQGVSNLSKVTEPNLLTNNRAVFPPAIFERLELENLQRIHRQSAQSTLPRHIKELKSFYDAQLSSRELKLLKEKMPTDYAENGKFRVIQNICAAMAANLTISAQTDLREIENIWWDTHNDHDTNAAVSLKIMFEALDFLRQEAARQGILDLLNIIVVSDFGRSPFYNAVKGKEHWSVGSMLFMGPDFNGNRMINATNSKLHASKMNLNTMQPDENGEKITVKMIHKTLRALTGNASSDMDMRFPIAAKVVPKLFTG